MCQNKFKIAHLVDTTSRQTAPLQLDLQLMRILLLHYLCCALVFFLVGMDMLGFENSIADALARF